MIVRICFVCAIQFQACTSQAEIIINVGDFQLFPDTPGQEIEILVSGGDPVEGLNFNVQIGDGGVDLGGTTVGPSVADIDILTGTIFDGNHTGFVDPEAVAGVDFPLVEIRTTTTNMDTVAADGLLATLWIDTTDIHSGVFPLILGDQLNMATNFAGLPATITDGTITIVPEPSSLVLALLGVIVAVGFAARRQLRLFGAREVRVTVAADVSPAGGAADRRR